MNHTAHLDTKDKSYTELTLTNRQVEVLKLLAQIKNCEEMVGELFISKNTLKFHMDNLYRLFEIEGNRFEKRVNLILKAKELYGMEEIKP